MAEQQQDPSDEQPKPKLLLAFTVPSVNIKGVQGSLTINAENMADLQFSLKHLPRLVTIIPPAADFRRTPEGEPICPAHDVVMTLREKQGDKWWNHAFYTLDAQGAPTKHYCRGYFDRKYGGAFLIPSDQIAWDFTADDFEQWEKEQRRGRR